ncbi:MAG: hypothetical protein V5A47_14210 [Bacteroidales bacterium]|nr:NAD(P)-dependent oxidoreductase [Bacteroidales bacterium]
MKILLTGVTGFIGKRLLEEAGFEVIGKERLRMFGIPLEIVKATPYK